MKKILFVLKHCNVVVVLAFLTSFGSVWYNYRFHSVPINVTNTTLDKAQLLTNLGLNLLVGSLPFITFILLKPYIVKVIKGKNHKRTYQFQIITLFILGILAITFILIFTNFIHLCVKNKSIIDTINYYYSSNLGCLQLAIISLVMGTIVSLFLISVLTTVWSFKKQNNIKL